MPASQGQIADTSSNDLASDPTVGQPSSFPKSRIPRDYSRQSLEEGAKDMKDQLSYRQILPPQPPRPYSHLPTPQSPSNISQYAPHSLYQPDSPIHSRPPLTTSSSVSRPAVLPPVEQVDTVPPHHTHVFMTPESSPVVQRNTLPRIPELNGNSPVTTPRSSSHINRAPTYPSLQASPLGPNGGLAPAPDITPSRDHTPSGLDTPTRATLTSPFITRLNLAERFTKSKPLRHTPVNSSPPSPSPHPVRVDDIFSTPQQTRVATPPISPPPAGGELDRIHRARLQDQIAQAQEAETRRPDYLKRVKRTISDVDNPMEEEDRRISLGIGITESPQKGRRLKLFQETSEESFEESLMAGGYGRYRTAEWVRQPQPLHTLAGPSNVVSLLEQEVAPTPQDLQKKRRLDAFRGSPSRTAARPKLQVIAVEGGGRALVEAPHVVEEAPPLPEPIPPKKRATNRRRKKGAPTDHEISAKEELAAVLAASRGPSVDGPNWPDSEFPWKLRTDERSQLRHMEEEERMKWIERFLDRDTDEEDEEEVTVTVLNEGSYPEEEKPKVRRGRGKWVPLQADPSEETTDTRKKSYFPTDPADARAALLAKKSIRTLSYRQQKRQRDVEHDEDEEVLCVCRGHDDGRELVQCDGCQTWYHLGCIGIKDIAQLGKEEDPWYCRSCQDERASNGSDDIDMADVLASEPTFVPSEDEPISARRVFGPSPFFHAPGPEDSPVPSWSMPRTPTRSRRAVDHTDIGSGMSLSSSSTWVDSSRAGPSTPRHSEHSVKSYSTPGARETHYGYDESPFDPTSTPSRGIKFGASFATPKGNNPWSNRAQNLFHSPSKHSFRDVPQHLDRTSGASYEPTAHVDSPFRPLTLPSYDDSPIGRNRSFERPPRHNLGRRLMEPRALPLADSPILKGRESINVPGPRREFLPPS